MQAVIAECNTEGVTLEAKRDLTKPDCEGFLREGAPAEIPSDVEDKFYFLGNIQKACKDLGVDLSKIDRIVISHRHGDHTGGLLSVVEQTHNVTVFLPHSFPPSDVHELKKRGAKVKLVKKPLKIARGVFSTGEMGVQIKEQSMIFDTAEGLVVVTGCSHQGIVSILKKAMEILDKDIYLVFGGFHLLEHSEEAVNQIIEEFRKLGVKKCGATQCTGDAQIQQFKDTFKEDYVKIGVGKVIEIQKRIHRFKLF